MRSRLILKSNQYRTQRNKDHVGVSHDKGWTDTIIAKYGDLGDGRCVNCSWAGSHEGRYTLQLQD